MTRYDKIYIPHDAKNHGVTMDSNWYVYHEGFGGLTKGSLEEVTTVKNVIVLTIEEALEMWNSGREVGQQEITRDNLSKVTAPHFWKYIQSKGINI